MPQGEKKGETPSSCALAISAGSAWSGYEKEILSNSNAPSGIWVCVPWSSMDSGVSSVGCKRPQAARPRSIKDKTQPAANIGQINWPKYILNAVNVPMVSAPCQTSAPPSPSVKTVALTSAIPTAGSNAASQRWACRLALAAASVNSEKRAALRASRPRARKVRTPVRVSCTWSLSLPKHSSESLEAW